MSSMKGKHIHETDGAHAKARAETNIPGRVWLGLLVVLTLASGHSPDDPPVYFTDAAGPRQTGALTLADLLDKIGKAVGRAWCWMEAKLGLRPKDWPQVPN